LKSTALPGVGYRPNDLSFWENSERTALHQRQWDEMMYRISYEDGWAAATDIAVRGAERTEYFRTEHEALHRARELIESGLHHGVSVYDGDGNALAGVRLQLKLGACVTR
jgi:hypothetical protein